MRTISTDQNAILTAAGATRSSHVRVKIKDSGGAFVDYSDLRGYNWIDGVDFGETVDAEAPTAVVTLAQRSYELNVSPFWSGGALADYIAIGRDIEIECAVMPEGVEPAPSDWIRMFAGTVDGHSKRDNLIELRAIDAIAYRLQIAFIESEIIRGSVGGTAVEGQMQNIMNTSVPAPVITLNTPVSPGWLVKQWIQRREPVYRAIRALAHQIGWDVRPRWDNTASNFGLYFEEPERVSPSVDREFGPAQYYSIDQLEVEAAAVRNVIKVIYYDGTTLSDGSLAEKEVVRTASDVGLGGSITTYGRRYMEVAEASTSNIDTATEAQDLADALLRDLADPEMNHGVTMPFFWPIQLRDYYRWLANGRDYDTDQELAVFAYRHVFKAGQAATTQVVCTGKPRGGFRTALDREFAPGGPLNRREAGPIAVQTLSATQTALGVVLELNRSVDHTWDRYEIHRSTSSGFTPGPSTFLAMARANTHVDKDLTLETLYYYKAIALDRWNNDSPVSNQVASSAAKVNTQHLNDKLLGFVDVLKSGPQSSLSDGDVITWETENNDRNNEFDLATERFTANGAGVRAFVCRLNLTGEPTSFVSYRAQLVRDPAGSAVVEAEGTVADGDMPASLLSAIIACDDEDVYEIQIQISGGSTDVTISETGTRWQIARLPSDASRT